ncbi:MAG: hypothetical protein JNK05_22570 [Myxococcales bacterium]|nr:hypothetical protein [Myxococcales bacterium]
MGLAGEVLGQRAARSGEAPGMVLESYEATTQRPLVGPPRRPTVIRTVSAEVAAVLRGAGTTWRGGREMVPSVPAVDLGPLRGLVKTSVASADEPDELPAS